MRRFFTYTDAEGVKQGGIQNVDAGNETANRLLGHTADGSRWTNVEVFAPSMPLHEIKRRVDEIRAGNGLEPNYPDEEKVAPPEGAVAVSTAKTVVKDHGASAAVGTSRNFAPVAKAGASGVAAASGGVKGPAWAGGGSQPQAEPPASKTQVTDHAAEAEKK